MLKPIAKSVSNKGKAENYVVQLIQLDVKHLLKVHNEEDDKVVQSFAKSLKDYVSQNRRSINFSKERTFQKIVVSFLYPSIKIKLLFSLHLNQPMNLMELF